MNTTTHEQSHAIAAHVAALLVEMRAETNMARHKQRGSDWLRYADAHGVCKAIRNHVAEAYSEVANAIKDATPARAPSDPPPVGKMAAAGDAA